MLDGTEQERQGDAARACRAQRIRVLSAVDPHVLLQGGRPQSRQGHGLRRLASGRWRKGLHFALEMAKEHRPTSAFDLHPWVYRDLRRFGLDAQLACACRDKAFETWHAYQRLRAEYNRRVSIRA